MGPSENLLADWTWVLRERRTQSMAPTCLPLTPGQWASPTSVGNAGVGRGRGAGPGPPGGDSGRRRACGARRLQGWAPGAGAGGPPRERAGRTWEEAGPAAEQDHVPRRRGEPTTQAEGTEPTTTPTTTTRPLDSATREAPTPLCRSSVWNTPERRRPGGRRGHEAGENTFISGCSCGGGNWAVARDGPRLSK